MMVRIFKHYLPTQIIVLAMADLSILFGSMYLGVELRFIGRASSDLAGIQPIWPKALAYATVMFVIMYSMGLYEYNLMKKGKREYYTRFMMVLGLGWLCMAAVFYALPGLFLGRGAFVLTMLSSFLGTAMARGIFVGLAGHDVLRRRILVLGTGARAANIESLLAKYQLGWKFDVAGYLPVDSALPAVERSKLIERNGSLLTIATRYQIQEIVVAVRERRDGNLPMAELLECKLDGINVVDLPSFFERETGHVQLDSLNSSWMVFSDGFCRSSVHKLAKRIFDVTASVMLLAMTLPVFVATALLIGLESGMPVFYRQIRVGECGRPFYLLKFRSMRVDAECDGEPQWARKGDDRVTRVGRVIRQSRIDELPQLFNVLRGDMSFVGPRPERPYFARELEKKIPYYASRHTVKPGITGWAQIRYPYGASVEDAREKLQYDLYYAKNHSLFLDALIMLQTTEVVLLGKGAR